MIESCKGFLCNVMMVKCLTQGREECAIIRWLLSKRMLGWKIIIARWGRTTVAERPAVATGRNDCRQNSQFP